MDENDKPDGSTAMERLCREMAECVVERLPASWCQDNGIYDGEPWSQCKGIARADIERRIAEADLEDDKARDVALGDWREKVAELDVLCVELGADDGDEALMVAGDLMDEHYELKELREAGRVMPEGVSWPRYEDGEPVRVGDVMRGTGRSQHIFRVVGVAPGNGRMTVVCEDVDEDCELCYTDPRLLAHERPDSWGRLREDARKVYPAYWGCIGFCCDKCPALVDGKKPSERYDTAGCHTAEQLDLLVRAERLAGVRDDG